MEVGAGGEAFDSNSSGTKIAKWKFTFSFDIQPFQLQSLDKGFIAGAVSAPSSPQGWKGQLGARLGCEV